MVAQRDHAKIGNEGGERVVRNLGLDRRDSRDEGGFSRVGVPDDPHVGDQLQFQAEGTGFTFPAGFGPAGSLVGGGRETGIPPASPAAPGDDEPLIVLGKVSEEVSGFSVPDDCPHGHWEDEVRRASAFLVFSFSVLASFGVVKVAVTKIEEGGKLAVGLQDHVPAFSAVAAVRASPGNVFLTAKADATVSSVSGLDEDFGFIDEFDR